MKHTTTISILLSTLLSNTHLSSSQQQQQHTHNLRADSQQDQRNRDLGIFSSPSDARTEILYKQQNDRKCDETIDIIDSPSDVTSAVNNFLTQVGLIFNNPDGLSGLKYTDYYKIVETANNRQNITFEATHGIKAVKVCARCGWFRSEYLWNKKYRDICGSDAYGSDSKFSGLVLIPIDGDTGKIPHGKIKAAFRMRSIQTDSFRVPSSKWPSTEDGGLSSIGQDPFYFLEFIGDIMTAASGHVTIIPDNLGYGESRNLYKGIVAKKLYQTSSIPIWLETKQLISRSSWWRSSVDDTAIVSGYSEGGYGAVAVAESLKSVGVDVVKVQAGAVPIDLIKLTDVAIGRIIDDELNPDFAFIAPLIFGTYSSTIPNLANFDKEGQNLLSDSSRLRILSFVFASLSLEDTIALTVNAFGLSGQKQVDNVNTGIMNKCAVDAIQSNTSICEVGCLNDLCTALEENSLVDDIEDASYPVEICQSPYDELIPFTGESPLENTLYKPSISEWLGAIGAGGENVYSHGTGALVCVLTQAFTAINDLML